MAVQFRNNLPRMIPRLERELSKLVKKTAFRIEGKWKADVRVDTGNYKNSIQTQIEGQMKATIGSPVEYGPANEFGTRHMVGRPSATTAADTEGAEFEKDVKKLERSLR